MATVIGNLRVVLGLDAAAFQQGMADATKRLRSIGDEFQRVGKQMSARVTAPIVGFGVLSLRTAAQFETSMNQVAAVTSATGDDLEALKDQARELGATTQFSASQAADAMNFLGMAGMKTNEILAAMPDTLKLASAAQLDMGDAADIVTNILAGYSMGVEDLAHANDALVTAFTSANTDLRQLGEAMKYAGPVASAAGVEFEEAAAALAMMGNAGIQGSMAGTSLRGAISRILSPTKAMQTRMREAGLSFTDTEGRILPLVDIIEQLEPHAEDAGLMMELFGQRAGPAMAALVSQGADSVRELTGELRDSAGAADRVSSVQMEGLTGAMRELKSAFEELQLAIANSGLIEWATDFVKWLTRIVAEMGKTNPEMLKWGTIIAGAAAAVGPLLIGIGVLVKGLALVTAAFAAVGAPVVAAIAVIATAATAMIANWDTVGPWFGNLFEGMGQTVEGFAQLVSGIVTGDMAQAVEGMKNIWQGLQLTWDTIWNGITGTVTWAWETVIAPVLDKLGMLDGIVAAWEAVREGIDGVLRRLGEVFDWFMLKVEPVIAALEWLDRNPKSAMPEGVGNVDWAALGLDAIRGLRGGTEGISEQGVQDARDYLDGFRDGMGIQSPSTEMIAIGQYLSQGLAIGIDNGLPQVEAATQTLGEAIQSSIETHFSRLPRSMEDVKNSFRSMLEDMANQLWRSGLTQLLSSLFGGGGLMSGLGITIPGFATGVQHFAGGMATIHERGGELAIMPSGSTVIPHDLSKRMVDGQGDAGHVDVRVYVDQDGNWEAAVERISGRVAATAVAGNNRSRADTQYLRGGR